MQCKFAVFSEFETHISASMKAPAQDLKQWLLLDMSEPQEDRMRSLMQYTLRDGEDRQFFGKGAQVVLIGVHQLQQGKAGAGKPYLNGRVVDVISPKSSPLK